MTTPGGHDDCLVPTLDALADRFVRWRLDSRGDSARGRHRHTLMLLELAWQRPGWPLHRYRPRRNPGAFLALVADISADVLGGALPVSGPPTSVRERMYASWRERLARPWTMVLDDLRAAGWPTVARVLEAHVVAALQAEPGPSSNGAHGGAGEPSLAQALTMLGVAARDGGAAEQHPAAGDVRLELRRRLDPAWSRALQAWSRTDLVGFLAAWPVDAYELLTDPTTCTALSSYDFAVAYAWLSDARAPGRTWCPPPQLLPADPLAQETFAALAGRASDDPLTRREFSQLRLGLSATFPATIAGLDRRLATRAALPELHAGARWLGAIEAIAERVAVARRTFLEHVAAELEADA